MSGASNTSSLTNVSTSVDAMSVCMPFIGVSSRGIFHGESPLDFAFPILLVQLGVVSFFCGTFRVLLKPLGQPNYVADILGGIVLGPTFMGHGKNFYEWVSSNESVRILDVYALLGIYMFNFIVGIRADVNVVKRAGSLSLIIGITSFCLPLLLTKAVAVFLESNVEMEEDFQNSLYALSFLQSIINFHGTYSILIELKLLNSELGRLVLSSSMIGSICSWFSAVVWRSVMNARSGLSKQVLGTLFSRLFFAFSLVFICRPMMSWMIKKTPEAKTLKEQYVCTLSLMVMVSIFYCQVTGIEALAGTLFLGVTVPPGPPLGSGLVDKLELFTTAVFFPSFTARIGEQVDAYLITWSNFWKVELVIGAGFLGKIVGTMVTSIYRQIPVVDAFLIGLLMSCQGLFDIGLFIFALRMKTITAESFSIMVIMAILQAGIIKPLVGYLYNPSRKNLSHKRRTIQHSTRNAELRILACISQEDEVPGVIDILEASNPTLVSPIGVYVLELVELVGQAIPLLIHHRKKKLSRSNTTQSHRIIKAFHQFQMRNEGIVSVQCFTAIAPLDSIYDDICSLSNEKTTSLVIIPFHKSDGPALRVMQKKVLQSACCSVGILVDRALTHGIRKVPQNRSNSWFSLRICVIFIGGPDDREALAYASRMAEHPNITINVVRIYKIGHDDFDLVEAQLDLNAVNDFRIIHADNSRAEYKEEGVHEGPETAEVLHTLSDEGFDLILVGRRQEMGSSLVMGLSEWCEYRELGVIGDILISSDFKSEASVLVVQQAASGVEYSVTEDSIPWSRQYF